MHSCKQQELSTDSNQNYLDLHCFEISLPLQKVFLHKICALKLVFSERIACLLYSFGQTVVYLVGLKVIFPFQTVLILIPFLGCVST